MFSGSDLNRKVMIKNGPWDVRKEETTIRKNKFKYNQFYFS